MKKILALILVLAMVAAFFVGCGDTATEDDEAQSVNQETNNDAPVKEAEEEKTRAQKYMITFDKEQKLWVVKKTGAKKASKKFKTKPEAVKYADRLSSDQGLSLTVKKKDGKFQKSATVKKIAKQ